jgi:hypothetical protein
MVFIAEIELHLAAAMCTHLQFKSISPLEYLSAVIFCLMYVHQTIYSDHLYMRCVCVCNEQLITWCVGRLDNCTRVLRDREAKQGGEAIVGQCVFTFDFTLE